MGWRSGSGEAVHTPRVSGLDNWFLSLEGPAHPFHQCSLAILDVSRIPGGYSFEKFRDTLAARALALPGFRAKLADSPFNPDTPVWVDDRDFDVNRHIRRVDVPAPGGREELAAMVRPLVETPMDRRRPLWDLTVLEGVDGDPASSGRIGLFIRTHHVFADGVSSANMWAQLYADGDTPPPPRTEQFGTISDTRMVLRGLRNVARRPWFLITEVLPRSAVASLRTVRRLRSRSEMAGLFMAPPTILNGRVGEDRVVAFAHLELRDVLAVKEKYGVKVNDVVAALTAAALRDYLLARAALPDKSLVARMPVSIYDATRLSRNQLITMGAKLHTGVADPVERLMAIARANSLAKEHVEAVGDTMLLDWADVIPGLLKWLVRLRILAALSRYRPVFNLSFSNVRGSQQRIVDAPIVANYPFGPVFMGAGLNVTVSALNDGLDFGFVACPNLLDDVWELADGVTAELDRLLAASTPATDRRAAS